MIKWWFKSKNDAFVDLGAWQWGIKCGARGGKSGAQPRRSLADGLGAANRSEVLRLLHHRFPCMAHRGALKLHVTASTCNTVRDWISTHSLSQSTTSHMQLLFLSKEDRCLLDSHENKFKTQLRCPEAARHLHSSYWTGWIGWTDGS